MKKRNLILIALIVIFVLILGSCLFQKDYVDEIEQYAREHQELTFGEVLDFTWDEAYNELNYYGRGKEIKDLTGYDFDVEPVGVDHMRRLLFFSEGKLVKEIVYEYGIFIFPQEVIAFYPDSVFSVYWDNYLASDGNTYEHLVLNLVE